MTFPLLHLELPAALSAGESAELSASLAALARSGLPLEGGLAALAEEVAQPRLARVLRDLAARLTMGENLETAIVAQCPRLPAHLRALIVAGVRSGRLPVVLDQFAALARRQQDLLRRMLLTFAYPAVLLGIMAAIMVFIQLVCVREFEKLFDDFHTKLPEITYLYIHYVGVVAWLVAGLAIAVALVPLAAMFLPLGWLGRATSWVPVLGPIVRHDYHARFAALMALLVEEQVPLPDALRLTSSALQGTATGRQCCAAAVDVEEGMSLAEALADARFPESLTAMVGWGQRKNCLAEAFRTAAEAFAARTNSQSALLNMLVLPCIYMTIVTFVGITIIALLMPLLSLIFNLSGGK